MSERLAIVLTLVVALGAFVGFNIHVSVIFTQVICELRNAAKVSHFGSLTTFTSDEAFDAVIYK